MPPEPRKITANSVVLPPLEQVHSPNQSQRLQPVHLVVVHDTEGSYSGAIETFANPNSEVSAHVVIRSDGRAATQCVPWERKAWSCEAYNSVSDNIEMAGFESKGYKKEQLLVTARVVAFRLHKRNLPCVWSHHGTTPGFCRHYDLGLAGGGHTDPTTSLDAWLKFCQMVGYQYHRGDFRPSWGV